MPEASYFAIPKQAMEEAMKLLESVPTRNGITSSEFIKTSLLDSKHLIMSLASEVYGDAIIPLASKQDFKDTLYLDRRMLKPFISAGMELTKSDVYEFKIENKTVLVKHGNRTALLESNNSASGYEKRPTFEKSLSIELQEEWTNIANCATLCACTDPIAPALNCIHVSPGNDKVYIRASDTKLVFQGTIPAKAFPCTEAIALPLELVDRLTLFSTGVCHYTPKWAMLQFPIGYLWQAVKAECRKSFPVKAIAEVVKNIVTDGKVVSVLGTQSLVESADRISDYMQAASRDNPALVLKITSGKKKAILSSNTIGAHFNEYVLLEQPAEEDHLISWNMAAVLPVMQYCKNAGSAKIIQDEKENTCLKAGRVVLVTAKQKKKANKKGKK